MLPHHHETIANLVRHYQTDDSVIAIIIGGSLVKGWGKPTSDVDFMLVVTEERFARQERVNQLTIYDPTLATYEGGYVDGKYIDTQFLRDVNARGSEVARSAFMGTFTALCRDPEVETLIKSIPAYPEADRDAKIKSFCSEVYLWNWYVGEAVKRGDRYLLLQAITEIALFAGRLILAHNRLLYPYHKWLRRQIENAPDKPADYFEKLDAMLDDPNPATAQAFTDCVVNHRDWGVTFDTAVAYFTRDRELNWRDGRMSIHDW